jgi:CheY-like chemotaxis protein
LSALKSQPETSDIPVLIVSITEDRQMGLALGAVEVMVKPVDKNRLIEAVAKAGANAKREPVTVLVIDDEPAVVEMLTGTLRPRGYAVIEAFGGRQGIDLAREHTPDVIVLDLMMPEVTGFDVVQQLRTDPKTEHIPILVFTAKDVTQEDRRRLKQHVRAIVSKTGKDDLLRELEKASKDRVTVT